MAGTGSGWDQTNAYNGVTGHPMAGRGNPIVGYIHNKVERRLLGGTWGEKWRMKEGTIDTTNKESFNFIFDDTLSQIKNFQKAYIVVFVSDSGAMSTNDYLVHNAIKLGLNDTVINNVIKLDTCYVYKSINQTICEGDTFLNRTTSGTYIDTLVGANNNGCDSIRTLNLTVNPKTYSSINQTICSGDTFLNRTISGTYIDTLKNSNSKGCDSIRTLNLTVNPKTYSTINQTICLGQSYLGRTTSGTYIDTLKNANNKGCDSIRTLNLTVIDKPLISGVISGSTTVCQGQSNISYSVIEASNNPTKYNWSLPNGFNGVSNTNKIPVNILSNAISGILTVMSENTCGNSNILSLPVIVNPKPQKPIISNNGNSLISSSLNGNQWYDLNGLIAGANNTVYIGTPNNSYYVLVTENGCISDPSNIISLSSSEVVELLNKGIKIYPNPFSELLNIEVSHKDHIEYLLTTVDGKVIKKDKFMERYKIDTKKLASGTYFLIIKDKDQYESFKIIKK
jgi:hypothetical protein